MKIEVKVYYPTEQFPELGDAIRQLFVQLGMEQWAQGTDIEKQVSDMAFDWLITEENYDNAMKELEQLLDTNPDVGTLDDARLNFLSTILHEYESRVYPLKEKP